MVRWNNVVLNKILPTIDNFVQLRRVSQHSRIRASGATNAMIHFGVVKRISSKFPRSPVMAARSGNQTVLSKLRNL